MEGTKPDAVPCESVVESNAEHYQGNSGWRRSGCSWRSRRGVLTMKIFNTLRAVMSGGTTGFNSLEKNILHAVMAQLGSSSAEKLRRRIDQVTLVQRHDGGREVNCYQMLNGKPAFDESMRLVNTEGEQVFAKFSFTAMDDVPFTGQMWLVNGIFFSLEFDNPTEHAIDGELKSLRVELVGR